MKIEINPRSLLNLEHIVEVLYKLHPSILNDLVEMERSLGGILGTIDLSNPSLEEREFLSEFNGNSPTTKYTEGCKKISLNYSSEEKPLDITNPVEEHEEENINGKSVHEILTNAKVKYASDFLADGTPVFKERLSPEYKKIVSIESLQKQLEEEKADRREERFHELIKYLQLDTYEYIPMKIFVEVEDPVIGRKVKELVATLERTGVPEQFYLHKNEIDVNAYFAEGYGLTINKEQKMKYKKFFWTSDADALRNLLIKEKLYS